MLGRKKSSRLEESSEEDLKENSRQRLYVFPRKLLSAGKPFSVRRRVLPLEANGLAETTRNWNIYVKSSPHLLFFFRDISLCRRHALRRERLDGADVDKARITSR